MTGIQLAVAVVLLLGNALFVAAEFSAISVRRAMLEPLTETSARARRVLNDLRSLSMLLAGAQLGITLCSLGLGAVAEPAVAHVIEGGLDVAHVPEALLHPIAFAVALALVVFLHMVLGEMVPKNLSLSSPERLALVLVPALAAFVRVTRPLIRLLNGLAYAGLHALNVEPKDELEAAHTHEELAEIIAESRSEGLLDPNKHERLTGALALENLSARDIMIPVDRLVTVSPSITADQLEDLVAETGYSRFPVSSEGVAADEPARPAATPARTAAIPARTAAIPARPPASRPRSRLNPARALPGRARLRAGAGGVASNDAADGRELLGFVHAKDVLGLSAAARRQPLPLQRLRTMPSLAPQQPLSDVLTELQRIGSHLGQVWENNRTVGVIALEDVVEAFVGEVEDASHFDAELDPQPGHEYSPQNEAAHTADPSANGASLPPSAATAQEADRG
ncbi:MAG TPA: hemolysin family protein [Frankiaceae bacterium]|nr:hemolysin family protein [Frankiaceae bacterium]